LRDGHWAIDHRTHILDMQTIHELTRGDVNQQSRRDPQDASYPLLNNKVNKEANKEG
jgi:hypothetical protein